MFFAQSNGGRITDQTLEKCHWDQGQCIAEDEISRSHRCGVQSPQEGGAPVLGDDRGRKQGNEGQTEDGDPGS